MALTHYTWYGFKEWIREKIYHRMEKDFPDHFKSIDSVTDAQVESVINEMSNCELLEKMSQYNRIMGKEYNG